MLFSSTEAKPEIASSLLKATTPSTENHEDLKAMAGGIQAWFDHSGPVTPVDTELAAVKRRAQKTRPAAHKQ